MYKLSRSLVVRHAIVSACNGGITLVILLIAPLGLAAVITNTVLVTVSTYFVSDFADRVIGWLEPEQEAELISQMKSRSKKVRRSFSLPSLGKRRR